MWFIKKEKVQQNLISDQGIENKTDVFSIIVIIFSTVMSIILIVLGALILFL